MKNESYLIPGEQAVSVISAMEGGFAEEILRIIAHPKPETFNPVNNKRKFGVWEDNMCFGKIIVNNNGYDHEERELVLKLNVQEGLFLKDDNVLKFSLKHECDGEKCVIPVVGVRHNRRGSGEIKVNALSIANNIVASWIVHGYEWIDRKGHKYHWPYGVDLSRKVYYNFSVVDGENNGTFSSIIKKGAVRAGHIGTWESPAMLVPAAMGLPVILHEFQEKSEGIVLFDDQRISPKACDEVWGPYTEWDDDVFNRVDFNRFQEDAQVSASPFNFHVTATRNLFPNCVLSSKLLLDGIGEDKALKVLEIIAKDDPERYYRLIDESGLTYRLKELSGNSAVYSGFTGDIKFNLDEAPQNALETFKELAKIQNDPGYEINRKVRIVLDSHFFIVLFAILKSENEESHHISGRYMHKYLLKGQDSGMHRIRNDRLFCLIRQVFNMERLKFIIYPSVKLRLPRVNQYNFDSKTWNPQHWLVKKI